MIVKNEAQTIEACLHSVQRLVDYVLIEDTGSTDGTQAIIRSFLAHHALPGEVFEEPWQDFATNRSIGLARLRQIQDIDYALVLDADDRLEMAAGFDPATFKASMDKDYYDLDIRLNLVQYTRPHILSNHRPFGYRGVLHEFVDFPSGDCTHADAAGLSIVCGTHGARSQDPQKYQHDAELLERALQLETDSFLRSRYTYYLAQSYRDAGQSQKALEHFLLRAELGYWTEEVFVSLLCAARLMQSLYHPVDHVLAIYDRATAASPARIEARHGAARLCNQNGRSAQAYEIAKPGLDLPPPHGGLFIETPIYRHGLRDEFAIAAYWTGAYAESLQASLTLLGTAALPEQERERVGANARFALEKLPKITNLGYLGRKSYIDQYAIEAARDLCARIEDPPRVLIAILAKQAQIPLPLYLDCIEALDYPKSAIVLHIRTNNNTDDTENLLRNWIDRVGHLYAAIDFDATDVPVPVQQFDVHEWNPVRFAVLGQLRNGSLRKTLEYRCDFLFVADTDNFIRPQTLRNLMAADLPIVAPLLRSIEPNSYYSNFFAETSADGYFAECDQYHWILERRVCGLLEMPVVHCTYLVRADVIPHLTYTDGTDRYEFVVFSDSARRAAIPQYIDNREVYGYIGREDITLHVAQARALLAGELLASKGEPYPVPLQAHAVAHMVGDGM